MESHVNWRLNRQLLDQEGKTPGVIVLPTESESCKKVEMPMTKQRTLFDPNNPTTPIVISSNQSRNYNPPEEVRKSTEKHFVMAKASISDQCIYQIPIWYDPNSDQYKTVRRPILIENLKNYDMQMQLLVGSGEVFVEWEHFNALRGQIQKILEQFLATEMKFAQNENLEHHFWKLLYYNIIELLKKRMAEESVPDNKLLYKQKLIEIIDNGNKYFEEILKCLQKSHHFVLDNYLGNKAGGENF